MRHGGPIKYPAPPVSVKTKTESPVGLAATVEGKELSPNGLRAIGIGLAVYLILAATGLIYWFINLPPAN